ncbi:hypothetical protein AB0K00_09980 [Dactylosporangium sp. NPDC049525]|uniref:hypothetical protein n=1 Tax=Dactylosporangium sp. NPDC049525 TaxID=3154730 RepID=UPI0034405BBE
MSSTVSFSRARDESCHVRPARRPSGCPNGPEAGDDDQRAAAPWEGERRPTLFDAAAYDAEVTRSGADHSWETAIRRAGRLSASVLVPTPVPV